MQNLNLGGVALRFLASSILVIATYNPSGHSYVHWVSGAFPHLQPAQAVAGIALVGLWIFFLQATWRSLGTVGVVIGLAFFAALVWLLSSMGWLSLTSQRAVTWVALAMIACLLTIGLCWALVQRRVTGQSIVEEVKH
jgi:Family of unknown function (DUF6524)